MAKTVARCARRLLLEHLAEALAYLPVTGSGHMAHNVLQNGGLHPNDLGAIPMTWSCLPAGPAAWEHMYVCAGSPSNIISSKSVFFFCDELFRQCFPKLSLIGTDPERVLQQRLCRAL